MAKRFIDTDTFRKTLVRGLEGPYKLLWLYLICECDHAGIWEVELDVVGLRLGHEYDEAETLKRFGGAIVKIEGGAKWHLPSFIEFQYGELNASNRVHKSVLNRLQRFNLIDSPERVEKNVPSAALDAATAEVDREALPPRPTEPPLKAIVDGFNKTLGDVLTPLSIPTQKRKEAIRIMWAFFGQDIKKIDAYWLTVRRSKFLVGRVNGKTFKATFDWLMLEDNAAKVLEGQYRNEGRNG